MLAEKDTHGPSKKVCMYYDTTLYCSILNYTTLYHIILCIILLYHTILDILHCINVAPLLVEGFGLMKSFREIIQNQLLFEGFGIMKSFWARNKQIADFES